MDLTKLAEPLPAEDIAWKPENFKGKGANMKVLAYVTARGVQDRLDKVCGPENWKVEYNHLAEGVLARLSIYCGPELGWVEKCDGAEGSNIESFKGGMSGAIKRAAVVWGVGRYLYRLKSTWTRRYSGEGRPGPEYTVRGNTAFLTPDYAAEMRKAGMEAPPSTHPSQPSQPSQPDRKHTEPDRKRTAPPTEAMRLEDLWAKRYGDPDVLLTPGQLTLIGTLRSEIKVSDEAYYKILGADYGVKSAKDLNREKASHLIDRMKKREAEIRKQDAKETFGDSDNGTRLIALRDSVRGYCEKLKTLEQRTARGDRLDYHSYGLDFDDITELEELLMHVEDEKELETLIVRMDTLFAGETF